MHTSALGCLKHGQTQQCCAAHTAASMPAAPATHTLYSRAVSARCTIRNFSALTPLPARFSRRSARTDAAAAASASAPSSPARGCYVANLSFSDTCRSRCRTPTWHLAWQGCNWSQECRRDVSKPLCRAPMQLFCRLSSESTQPLPPSLLPALSAVASAKAPASPIRFSLRSRLMRLRLAARPSASCSAPVVFIALKHR